MMCVFALVSSAMLSILLLIILHFLSHWTAPSPPLSYL